MVFTSENTWEGHWNGSFYKKGLHLTDVCAWHARVTVCKHITLTDRPALQISLCWWMWPWVTCHRLTFILTQNCTLFPARVPFPFWKWSLVQTADENMFRGPPERQSPQQTQGGLLTQYRCLHSVLLCHPRDRVRAFNLGGSSHGALTVFGGACGASSLISFLYFPFTKHFLF